MFLLIPFIAHMGIIKVYKLKFKNLKLKVHEVIDNHLVIYRYLATS